MRAWVLDPATLAKVADGEPGELAWAGPDSRGDTGTNPS